MPCKHSSAIRLALTKGDSPKSASTFESKGKSSDAAEEVEDIHRSPATFGRR
jgi:hypothetical protein